MRALGRATHSLCAPLYKLQMGEPGKMLSRSIQRFASALFGPLVVSIGYYADSK